MKRLTCALLACLPSALGAQRAQPAPTVWIGAGVGSAGSAGIGGGAEGWVAYRHLAVGMHDSSVDQWYGRHRSERSVLAGFTYDVSTLRLLAAAGVGRTDGTRSNGEQSGTRTQLPESRQAAFDVSLDWVFSRFVGLHASHFQIQGAQLGYGLTTLGFVAGKLR
jgi:hypothetical protein